MTTLTKDDTIGALYVRLAKDVLRINQAMYDSYEAGRLAEAEGLIDELMVITRFLNYSRRIVE